MNKQQGFLLVLIVVFGLLSLFIVLPLFEFVLLAIIVAYVLQPLNRRLEAHLGPRFAPAAVITIALLVVVLPVVYILWVLYRDLQSLAEDPPDLELEPLVDQIQNLFGYELDPEMALEEIGSELLQLLFGDIPDLIFATLFVAFGLGVVFFVVYYLLRDGEEFVAWMVEIAPINERVGGRLADQMDRTTRGVIVGHIFVAVLEGTLGGIAFFVIGIPNPIFWAFVMVVLSLLPIIGPFLVWAPWAVYLFVIESFPEAVFLFLWGTIVIGLIDNYARPIVIDREAHLNPAVILIGVFGGIYAIGVTGLFIGPIVLGVFAAALKVFHDEWDELGNESP